MVYLFTIMRHRSRHDIKSAVYRRVFANITEAHNFATDISNPLPNETARTIVMSYTDEHGSPCVRMYVNGTERGEEL